MSLDSLKVPVTERGRLPLANSRNAADALRQSIREFYPDSSLRIVERQPARKMKGELVAEFAMDEILAARWRSDHLFTNKVRAALAEYGLAAELVTLWTVHVTIA